MLIKKEQVIKAIREKLKTGEFSPGSKLKSGIALAKEFNVSHITVRNALKELSLSKELLVIHGKGIFVPNNKKQAKPNLLVIRIGDNFESPSLYIMPEFIAKVSEKGGQVTEINIQFIRNNPSQKVISTLKNMAFTGILLDGASYIGNEPEIAIVKELNLPTIIVKADPNDVNITGFDTLGCNIKQAWLDGLKAIIKTNKKRIALLLCDHKTKVFRNRTIEEHLTLLRTYGADSDPELIQTCANLSEDNSNENIAIAVDKLLSLKERPQAIYCFSDFIALKVYEILQSKNIRIPEDIGIMGFCGYPGGTLLDPPLATVDENYATYGKVAAEKLCDTQYFNAEHKAQWIEIPYTVYTRKSISK